MILHRVLASVATMFGAGATESKQAAATEAREAEDYWRQRYYQHSRRGKASSSKTRRSRLHLAPGPAFHVCRAHEVRQ